ncbi:MAG: hypothetical protein K5682_07695 [Lachnospiraceae bacterium]|nr:hypothetical protein [Lachnospiraceae bacterium]
MEHTDFYISKGVRRWIALYMVVSALRLWLGSLLGVWFPGEQGADDALMVLYSAFPNYFRHMTPDWLMLKELGMPVFLQIVNFSGISYPVALGLLWILDGFLLSRIAKKISGREPLAFGVYVAVIFVPASLEAFCGTRMYRAGLLNPMYVMLFALCLMMLSAIREEKAGKRQLFLGLLLGLILSFTYYIKEDGIWILAVTAAFALTWLWTLLASYFKNRDKKRLITGVVVLLLPFVILEGVTLSYKAVNYRFFGVFETNVRTSGESGAFVEKIYQIASEDRTNVVWAPKDAIEKAFKASPALNAHPELKEAIYTSWWIDGDIDAHPIEGDFLTWILKDAVFECSLVTNLQEKEAFFAQVNRELDAAFQKGILEKETTRRQILSSVGGKTGEEVAQIAGRALDAYGYHLLMKDYEPGGRYVTGEMSTIYLPAAIISNYNVLPLNESGAVAAREFEIKIANLPVKGIFFLGKILAPLLLVLAFAGSILTLVRFFRGGRKEEELLSFTHALIFFGLLAVSYVYSFMVMLFCTEFEERFVMAEKMYSVGVVSLLLVAITLGVSLLVREIDLRKSTRIQG